MGHPLAELSAAGAEFAAYGYNSHFILQKQNAAENGVRFKPDPNKLLHRRYVAREGGKAVLAHGAGVRLAYLLPERKHGARRYGKLVDADREEGLGKLQIRAELTAEGKPFAEDVQVGIMIETPAAAVISDRLAKEVDFFSCGTNDLTQYTLACDRQNNDLGRFFNAHHPAVLRLLKLVCDNAHKNGIWVGICGELGADLELTETFLSIGID
ncbi:MAG: hypothetical protein IIT95_02670, partial [Oscillospiraceae bacterium]|nr:hypothetical protein [Oscillospiraceae bacterium]